jgi:hypothetical protein
LSDAFAFQFIAGKYEGGVYLIPADRDLMIGRGAELDIVLIEDMVSRRHASLASHDGRLVLTDLGSTNGTYVNGERIDACELEPQDRVLIGTSILRVASARQAESLLQTHPALDLAAVPEPQRTEGDLRDVPVGDLLRLFSSNRRTGLLALRGAQQAAEVVFVDGAISHASVEGRPALAPLSSLVEALGFGEGRFCFDEPAEGFERPDSFAATAEDTLKAAQVERAHIDALAKREGLAGSVQLALALPQPGPWSAASLSPEALDVLQLALVHGQIERVLRQASLGALPVLQALATLLSHGILQKRA